MPKLPNPPKSKRLTKKVGVEAMRLLDTIHYSLFVTGVLERPALKIDQKWLQDLDDRITACRANLHVWYNAEKEKGVARERKRHK